MTNPPNRLSRRGFLQTGALATSALIFSPLITRAAEAVEPFKIAWTFDDAIATQYTEFLPILSTTKAKATFYVVTGWMNPGSGKMSKEQVLELASMGHEIGGHTLSHPNLVQLFASNPKECERQIREDRETLNAWGLKATTFAYPFSAQNESVQKLVKAAGYTNARSLPNLRKTESGNGPWFESLPLKNPLSWYSGIATNVQTTSQDLKQQAIGARNAGGKFLAFLTHGAVTGPNPKPLSTHPQVIKEFIEWATVEGFVFTTVSEAIGL